MQYTVYERNRPVGELTMEPCGLYYEIVANIQAPDAVKRLYAMVGENSFYIGIPDRRGELRKKIPQKNIAIPQKIILSQFPPQQWNDDGELKEEYPTSTEIEKIQRETADDNMGEDKICIPEIAVCPPLIETENGGEENEIHTQNDCIGIDPLLLADLPADYDYGGTGAEEADCDHIR